MSTAISIILIVGGIIGICSFYALLRAFSKQVKKVEQLKAEATRMRRDYNKLLKLKKKLDTRLSSAQGQLARIPAKPRKKKPTRTTKYSATLRRENDVIRNHIKGYIK